MSSKKKALPPKSSGILSDPTVARERALMPPLYKVYIVNDDYTPMDFVTQVLEKFFFMDHSMAVGLTLQIHRHGKGTCGLYTREIAETKVLQVNEYSKRNQHPLLCKMEEAGAH